MQTNQPLFGEGGALQTRARAVPIALRLPLVAAPFGLVVYWVVTRSGLYAFFLNAEAEAGFHSAKLAAFASLLVAMVPAFVFVHLLAGLFLRRSASANR